MPPKVAKKPQPSKSPESKKNDKKEEELKPKQPEKVESPPKAEKSPPPPPPPEPEPEQQEQIHEGMDEATRRKKQADMFKKYLEQTGIAMAFQVVFAEILDKKVEEGKVFQYSAMRLRQIGEDLQKIKMSKK